MARGAAREEVKKKKPASTRMRSDPRLAGTAEGAVRENRCGTGRAKAVGAVGAVGVVGVDMSVDQKVSRAETVPVVFLKS